MERTTMTMVCLQERKETMRKATMIATRESISSGEKANNMQSNLRRNSVELHVEHKCAPRPRLIPLPKLKRDSVLRNVDGSHTSRLVEG